MFHFPFSTMHELNLDWFLQEWAKFKNQLVNAFEAVSHLISPIADPSVNVTYDADTQKYTFDFGLPPAIRPMQTLIWYQVGSSGTTPPTGTWLGSVPTVPQGKYLWIKTTVQYNDNYEYTFYNVSRFGVDGSKMHYYQGVTVNAGTNTQVIRIPSSGTDSNITTDSVIVEAVFSNPRSVISNLSWTSHAGYFEASGTVTSATTANITLAN